MNLELTIKNEEMLSIEEKKDLDQKIDLIIQEHRNNRLIINKLVFDSVNALTTSEARSNELKAQSPLKRIWGSLTGKNSKINAEIHKNLARAQYASQQTIQKLAEQNLMTFELITAVNNKLNSAILEIDDEINNIYSLLVKFFKQNRSDIIQLESRIQRLEQNVNLLNWINSIEYQMVDGVEYCELNDYEKIYRIAIDFYEITNGNWTTSDLLLLKSAISNIGLSVRDSIKYIDFIKYINNNRQLCDDFIKVDFELLEGFQNTEDIIVNGIVKSKFFDDNGRYILNVVNNLLESQNIKIDEFKYLLTEEYIKEKNNIDITKSINMYDFILELILNVADYRYEVNSLIDNIDLDSLSLEKLKQYAESGMIKAQAKLGDTYNKEKNYIEAIKWFKRAAEQGDEFSQNELGEMYYYGNGVGQNYSEAFKLFAKSANKNYSEAQYNMGIMYYYGYNVDVDYQEAVKWYKLSAEQGDHWAQEELGDCYYYGKGVEQDYQEAVKWYKLSAEQGYDCAQNSLGVCYQGGLGVEQNYEEAAKWYKAAAEQGYNWAQYNLGKFYYNGEGVEQNYQEAVKWYKAAAEQGNKCAQYDLGNMYRIGEGVDKDYVEAVRFYKLSAEQGNDNAQNNIGSMYYYGYGVEKNYKEAVKWYKLAVQQGNDEAQNSLGNMYYQGYGVEKNYEEAKRLYKLSADAGNERAINNLKTKYFG